jgi:hypothetical protein
VPSDRPREPQEGGGEEGLTGRITRGRAGAAVASREIDCLRRSWQRSESV